MKGLYGFWNFTDENAKLTREIAIMVASFIITAGASAFFNMVAVGGRALATTKALTEGGRIYRGIAKGSVFIANRAENGVQILNFANKSTLGRIVADATVFTSADTLARWAWSQEGEATTGF